MGIMGQAMAKNILKAGYELMVYNRTPEKTAAMGEAGARVAVTQNEIADWAEVIIMMVTGRRRLMISFQAYKASWPEKSQTRR